jgi:two-component system sensor histidine kinase PilS (NtrC family)
METGVVVIDEEGKLRMMNAAASQILGRAEVDCGRPLDTICPALSEWINEPGSEDSDRFPQTIRLRDRDIQPTLAMLGGEVARAAVVFLQDTQDIARRAQQIKLAALGKLSGSIAHNIRNPLAAISHAGQLLAESAVLHRDDRHLVDIVTRNALRIDETVQSILTLPRRESSYTQNIELAAWLADFRSDWAEGQRFPLEHFRLDIDQAPVDVRVDPRHLRQILVNLCDNAAHHARGAGSHADIQLHVGREQDGGRTIVEVLDDGPGVDAETARGIFDPFFTTSSAGTGLGLYVARELAETNGIRLTYCPRHTGGSCFRLTFGA